MRVGVLVHALTGGGGEAVARSWAEQLAARGHQVSYLLYGPDASAGSDPATETFMFPGRTTVDRWVRLPAWVRRTAIQRKFDVVLAVLTFSNLTALRALVRPWPRAIRVVLSEHTVPTMHWRYEGVGGQVKKQLARLLYGRADGVIAVSHPVATDLRARYGVGADRLFVLPNPVPAVDNLPGSIPANVGALQRVVVVGRLCEVKRIDRLFSVLDVLRARGLACSGVVIGDGPARTELEAHARRLRLPVQFLGWAVPWQQHSRPGDCLLVTADVEGFGNVLVEAAAAGLPAVAPSTALGVADALVPGLTGVLARSARADDLADALVEAAALPVHPQLIEPWLRTFSPALAGKRLEAILTKVQQRPRGDRQIYAGISVKRGRAG
jgi:glycosyltransferase involved in cell wall biosynthesis